MSERPSLLRQLFGRFVEQLTAAGIEQAEAEVEWILCHVLGADRLKLYLDGDALLTEKALARADEIIRRRVTRYPLQFILQESWFYGRKFFVTEAVMAPTPETEMLVESGLRFLGERKLPEPNILDVGVGSGVISVSLAKENASCRVVALDISAEALAVAKRNAVDHAVADRIEFRESDYFGAVPDNERFDLIISNPPYIAEPDYGGLDPEVKADPKIAMTSGPEGLDAIQVILREAPHHLNPGGRIMFEIGHDQAEKIMTITGSDSRYSSFVLLQDMNDRDRVIILGCD